MKKKRTLPPHIREAADRAEARTKGKKPAKPRKPINPPIVKLTGTARPKPEPATEAFGRPTTYKPSFVDAAKKLCLLGATDEEIADFFGVAVRTLYRWKLQHEDFCQAISTGKEIADSRVERSLYQKATGFTYTEQQAIKIKLDKDLEDVKIVNVEKQSLPDTQASLHWLYNRKPKQWRNVSKMEHTGADGSPIEIENKSGMDLARWIAFKLAAAATTPEPKLIEQVPAHG